MDAPDRSPVRHALALLPAVARRGFWTVAISAVIGLAIGALQQDALAASIIHSECIGLVSWMLIDGGRAAIVRWRLRARPDDAALRGGWPGWGWMGLLLAVGSPTGYVAGSWLGLTLFGTGPRRVADAFHNRPAFYAVMLMVTLGVGVMLTRAQYLRGQLEHARAEAERAARVAAETRLRLLESQLDPHMLFNTLANLRALVDLDPPRAVTMIDHLDDFLRATLRGSRATEHPVAAEFERLGAYLALIQVRMGARLQVAFDLPPALASLPIPTLLLQPLVENAVRHGLEPSIEGGSIRVAAQGEAGRWLELTVRDTGAGLPAPGAPPPGGFGLDQVRERLATLHGAAARLTLESPADGLRGTLARVRLPWPSPPPA